MTLRAREIIQAARFAHPAFDRALAPTSVCAQYLSEGQRRLMLLAHQTNPTYAVARWVIRLLPDQQIAQVGAGTGFGAPLVEGTTTLQRRTVGTGSAATQDATATVYVNERAVTSATADTLTDSTRSWTVNEYAGDRIRLVAGTGAGQIREIASNTATSVTVTADWVAVPDETTTYIIEEDLSAVGGDFAVQLGEFPAQETQRGWLVLLDATGAPYLDLSAPIEVPAFLGIPLPPNSFVDHGIVRFIDSVEDPDHIEKLTLTTLAHQAAPPRWYSAAVVNGTLQLFGPADQWRTVTSLELPYLPIPPRVTAEGDYLLLREDAEEALVGQVVLGLCRRARVLGVAGADPGGIAAVEQRAKDAELLWLQTVSGVGRAKVLSIREVY